MHLMHYIEKLSVQVSSENKHEKMKLKNGFSFHEQGITESI